MTWMTRLFAAVFSIATLTSLVLGSFLDTMNILTTAAGAVVCLWAALCTHAPTSTRVLVSVAAIFGATVSRSTATDS